MAVYQITFDDKYFYIGSSVNVRQRFHTWKCKLTNSDYLGVPKIKMVALFSKYVKFTILSIEKNESDLRKKEILLLKENDGLPLLLNSQTGVSHKKKKPSSLYKAESKRIALFDFEGNLLKEYNSKGKLFREHRCCRGILVNRVLDGKREHISKFKFKLIDDNGNYIEPAKFKSNEERYRREDFYQIDREGKIINTFNYTCDAAKMIGANAGIISQILKKSSDRKYTRDFAFVYAAEYNSD